MQTETISQSQLRLACGEKPGFSSLFRCFQRVPQMCDQRAIWRSKRVRAKAAEILQELHRLSLQGDQIT